MPNRTFTAEWLDPWRVSHAHLIRRFLSDHWDAVCDDTHAAQPEIIPVPTNIKYAVGKVDGVPRALWLCQHRGKNSIEVHTLLDLSARHLSGPLSRAGLELVFAKVGVVVSKVPDACEFLPARILASAMGFTRTHYQPASFLKGGVWYGQQHYKLTKEQHACNSIRNGGGGSGRDCRND